MKFLSLLIVATLAVSVPQPVKADGWQADSVQVEANCTNPKPIKFPERDLPSDSEKLTLQGCSSRDLYYGFNTNQDFVAARKCAFTQINGPFPLKDAYNLGGKTILTMIYANGYGVVKNKIIAIELACEDNADRSDIAKIMDVTNLQPYDICDNPQTTFSIGRCQSVQTEQKQQQYRQKLDNLMQTWTPEQKEAFQKLDNLAMIYIKAQSGNVYEEYQGGTIRSVYYNREYDAVTQRYYQALYDFENGKLPHYTKDDLVTARMVMATSYKNRMADIKAQMKKYPEEATTYSKDTNSFIPLDESLQRTEIKWINYKEAWVKFALLRYPQVTGDSIRTWATVERTSLLNHDAFDDR